MFIRFTALCNSSTVSSSPTDVVVSVSVPRRPRVVDVVLVVRSRLLEPPFPCERMSVRPSSVFRRDAKPPSRRERRPRIIFINPFRVTREAVARRASACAGCLPKSKSASQRDANAAVPRMPGGGSGPRRGGASSSSKKKKKTPEKKFKKGSVAKHKSTTLVFGEATFDDDKRKEWVTGYRKRKNGRRKQAAKDIEERARKERIAARKERRDAEKIALGLFDDDGGGDGGDDAGASEKPTAADAEKVERFDSGTTVTIAAGFPGMFDDDA